MSVQNNGHIGKSYGRKDKTMPTSSENIQRLETVDIIVNQYEWTCPHCGYLNKEDDFGVKMTTVQCEDCDVNFRVSDYWE